MLRSRPVASPTADGIQPVADRRPAAHAASTTTITTATRGKRKADFHDNNERLSKRLSLLNIGTPAPPPSLPSPSLSLLISCGWGADAVASQNRMGPSYMSPSRSLRSPRQRWRRRRRLCLRLVATRGASSLQTVTLCS